MDRPEAVGHAEAQHVLLELGRVDRLARVDAVELLDLDHRDVEVLFEVLLQAGQQEGVAQADDLGDLALAVLGLGTSTVLLQFAGEVREHRPHRLEDLLGVLAAGGGLLQVLRLGVRQLERLHQGLGESGVAAEGDVAEDDLLAVGDDQVAGLVADVEQHGGALAHLAVVVHEVEQGQRGRLHQLDVQRRLERLVVVEDVVDVLPLDAEDAGLLLGGVRPGEDLVVPDDLVDREGDLLGRLEPDDVGNLVGLTGGSVTNFEKVRLPGTEMTMTSFSASGLPWINFSSALRVSVSTSASAQDRICAR